MKITLTIDRAKAQEETRIAIDGDADAGLEHGADGGELESMCAMIGADIMAIVKTGTKHMAEIAEDFAMVGIKVEVEEDEASTAPSA